MQQPRIGIVVPTRNRPDHLVRLLDSLVESSVRPDVVVIVASGNDVARQVERFKNHLTIIYEYSSMAGQVRQKSRALTLLPPDLNWCIFTDDDLFFAETAISKAVEATQYQECWPVIGVGFALPPKSRIATMPPIIKWISRRVGLGGKKPGAVLPSGQGINYLHVSSLQKTEWLNGVSMWKYPEVLSYVNELPSSDYAACEDLIFSYSQRKKGVLLFAPAAKVSYQDEVVTNPESPKVFVSAAYWRLLFVRRHEELSVGRFYVAQLSRTLYAVAFNGLKYKKVYLKSFFYLLKDSRSCLDEDCLFLKMQKRIRQLETSR